MSPDLVELIADLGDRSSSVGVFAVREIPGLAGHYVGRDDAGRPCVLLSAADGGYRAPIRLSGLDVQYAIDCAVQLPERPEARQSLTVVRFTAGGSEGERYFLHVMGGLVVVLGVRPRIQAIAEAMMRVASIFQRLSNVAKESVTGLVGELILILKATNAAEVIAAWRQDADERYDFVGGNLRLEVKASMSRRRVHSLSYEQCDVPAGCAGVLVSLFVERSAGGLSFEALVGRIKARLAGDLSALLRLDQTIADTLGADLPEALSFSFDYGTASSSLAFFDLREIPAVRVELPPAVSQVRFVSDVTAMPPMDSDGLRELLPDFAPFVPLG